LKDGTSNPSLSRDTFSSQLLPLPTNREQQQIAGILGSLDDKIDLNRRMNETLEAMARAIFKSWFVDFDPVRAKMEGRQPVGIDAETAHLFPESFEESLLGLIPSGWRPCSWGDVITLEYGKSLRGYEKVQGDYTVFGTNGAIGRNDEALCQHPGIIVGRKGAYRGVHFHDEPFFVIDTAYYVEPKKPLELRWAYYQMLREDINGMDSGSAIPSTSRDQFYKVGLTYPPFPIQRRFVELLSPLWFRQRLSSQESFTLSAVRDVLLPKLLSGEIRVEHAERMIEGGM
jgi:type I restriction enzyme S subunit